MSVAHIAFGSNIGDRLGYIRSALRQLVRDYTVEVTGISPLYENRAVGMENAGPFLNGVAQLDVGLEPEVLMEACLKVEKDHGRVASATWQPRSIDLDMLLFEEVEMRTARLSLPHPRMYERDFVLKPLVDLSPDLLLNGRLVSQWLAALDVSELELSGDRILLSELTT